MKLLLGKFYIHNAGGMLEQHFDKLSDAKQNMELGDRVIQVVAAATSSEVKIDTAKISK